MLFGSYLNIFKNTKPSGRTPKYEVLKETCVIKDTFPVGQAKITVFKNGYVAYSKFVNEEPRNTVFHINKIDITYDFVDNTKCHINTAQLANMEEKDVLTFYGEVRLEHNSDSRHEYHSEYHLNNDGNDWTQETYTAPDMVENEAMASITRAEEAETLKRLHDAMSKLTPKQLEVIKKIYFEQKSVTQTASDLKLGRSTVNDHHKNALKKLRKYL